MEKTDPHKKNIFFPYYVNQGRLLDIYAILNDGYSEYSEITTAIGSERQKGASASVSASHGFKLINFGADVKLDSSERKSASDENKEKKIQTVTSILSIVKETLERRGYLVDIKTASPGNFVCIPVNLAVNSIKSLLSEMSDLISLSQLMGTLKKGSSKDPSLAELEKALKTVKILFSGEEILYMNDDYAITGNIVNTNLYQSERADIIGTELMCLAQVKRVYPTGTELMKNTTFSKITDIKTKKQFVNTISQIVKQNLFKFEAVAVTEITDRPVYQLEIIALYQ